MKIRSLVWHEIVHRKMNFAIGLLAVVAAAALSVGVVTLLNACQLQTGRKLAAQSTELQDKFKEFENDQTAKVRALDNEIRKITKELGFNLMILPADQNLSDFHSQDFAEKTMPEEYVQKLSKAKELMTIAHLRPVLVRKIDWPEQKRQLLLYGVTAIVPTSGFGDKKPLAEPVPKGSMHVGSVLAAELGLKPGKEVTLQGEKFKVAKVFPPRGNKDDVGAWIDLATAQKLTHLPGRINLMLALECNCASVDRLADVRKDVAAVLGGKVQVIELAGSATARAEARNQVQAQGEQQLSALREEGESTLKQVRADGAATLTTLQQMAAIVVPLSIVAACLMVALVSLLNVRERRGEIGVLRALGIRSRQVFALVMWRAALLGLIGAAVGYLAGFLGAAIWEATRGGGTLLAQRELFLPWTLLGVVVVGPLLAILAGWLPAMQAAAEDPAVALREE